METVRFLNREFKGTTRVRTVGSYTTKSGKVINETGARIESFAFTRVYRRASPSIRKFLKEKKKKWKQESIGYEFEETLYFV